VTVRRLAAGAVALALLVAGAAACSDDDGAAPDPTSTTALVFTGDAASAFCALLRDAQIDEAFDVPAVTPAELEANYTETILLFAEAAEQAPPEVQTDIGLVLQGLIALDDSLRAVGYSFEALEQSPDAAEIATALNDPAFRVAGERIEAYRTQVCRL
jgi:hypothetical protein